MGSRDKDQTAPHQPLLSSLVIRPSDSSGGGTGGSDYEPGELRREAPHYSRSDRFSDGPGLSRSLFLFPFGYALCLNRELLLKLHPLFWIHEFRYYLLGLWEILLLLIQNPVYFFFAIKQIGSAPKPQIEAVRHNIFGFLTIMMMEFDCLTLSFHSLCFSV